MPGLVPLLPDAVRVPTVGGQVAFRLPPDLPVSEIFRTLNGHADELGMKDWGVNQAHIAMASMVMAYIVTAYIVTAISLQPI